MTENNKIVNEKYNTYVSRIFEQSSYSDNQRSTVQLLTF